MNIGLEPLPASGEEELRSAGQQAFGENPLEVEACERPRLTVLSWQLHGEKPTQWVLMTLGLSDLSCGLYPGEVSGRGYELTCRVEAETPPQWLIELLADLAARLPASSPTAAVRTRWSGLSHRRRASSAGHAQRASGVRRGDSAVARTLHRASARATADGRPDAARGGRGSTRANQG